MYHYFFSFLYKYYDRTDKWKDAKAPLISSVLVISVLLGLNFLTLRDVYFFQIKGIRYPILDYKNTIVLTILIALNYLYFRSRYKRILRKFDEKNQICKVLSCIYILITIVLAVITAYSVRNGITWF